VIPLLLAVLSVACLPATPFPLTPTPVTPSATPLPPTPTPAPSPTPTATPIPPQVLSIWRPEGASGLQPVAIEAELIPPPGVAVTATLRATVYDPDGMPYWEGQLLPREGNLYVSEDHVQFPLDPPPGEWLVIVFVESPLAVEGDRGVYFRLEPVPFRDFAADVAFRASAGVRLRVPQAFAEVVAEGDAWAGGRVWRYGDGEVGLWWAPGAVEPMMFSTALVMVEATYDPDAPARVLDVEEVAWQGQKAFLFHETWPGPEGGPGEALVVQGPDYWLYVVRMRALGTQEIPPLVRRVWETFAIAEE